MATTTASAQTLAIAEIADNICSYSEGNELFALALTSKTVSVSALDMLWKNVQTLKDLFLIIPGCFVEDYGLVSTKTFLFLFFFSNKSIVSAVQASSTRALEKVQADGDQDS